MDLQIEAIRLAFKESPVFSGIGAFLLNGEKSLYTVDEVIEQIQSLKPSRQSDATFRSDVVQFLQRLEKYGAGSFTAGRRGMPSRFNFYPGVPAILKTRMPEATSKSTERAYWTSDPRKPEATARSNNNEEPVKHTFVLRRGYPPVSLELPSDLTEQEAERLAQFIKTLPLK